MAQENSSATLGCLRPKCLLLGVDLKGTLTLMPPGFAQKLVCAAEQILGAENTALFMATSYPRETYERYMGLLLRPLGNIDAGAGNVDFKGEGERQKFTALVQSHSPVIAVIDDESQAGWSKVATLGKEAFGKLQRPDNNAIILYNSQKSVEDYAAVLRQLVEKTAVAAPAITE